MRGIIIMTVLMCGVALAAMDITTLDGKTYHNVQVSSVTPAGFDISYTPPGGGIAIVNLKFKNLPEKIRKEYHYNPQKAAHFERRVNYYQQRKDKKLTKQYEAQVREEQNEERRQEELNAMVISQRRNIVFKSIMSLPNGTVGWVDSIDATVTTGHEGKVFLVGKNMPQDNEYQGYIYPIGQTFQYLGENLPCYVTNMETATMLWNPKGAGSTKPVKNYHNYRRNYRDLYNIPSNVLHNYYTQ